VSQVVAKSINGESILFGYDHAIGFFFDKYEPENHLFPAIELSTLQDDLNREGLIEQIDKWLEASEKTRVKQDIENVLNDGLLVEYLIPKHKKQYSQSELILPETKREIIQLSPSFGVLEKLVEGGIDLSSLHWREFEELIAELLEKDGYSVELGSGRSDGGKDLIAIKDLGENGLYKAVWQAKHKTSGKGVGVSVIRELADTRNEHKASKGVLVTSTYLTRGALERVQRDTYVLGKVDKGDLLNWIDRIIRDRRR
jgi:HJR/Mrr/RecB family endonuclease